MGIQIRWYKVIGLETNIILNITPYDTYLNQCYNKQLYNLKNKELIFLMFIGVFVKKSRQLNLVEVYSLMYTEKFIIIMITFYLF